MSFHIRKDINGIYFTGEHASIPIYFSKTEVALNSLSTLKDSGFLVCFFPYFKINGDYMGISHKTKIPTILFSRCWYFYR